MFTKIVRGTPKEFIEKRKNRIKEAVDIKFDEPNNPVKYVVDVLSDETEVYFIKPGKEYFRASPNYNDMAPDVGGMFTNFSFADIWQLLCRLRNAISSDNYKKLSVILYRVAYLIDFDDIDGKVRFAPCNEILEEIQEIQKDADENNLNINILAFIHFIDLLAWNDEVKKHADKDGMNYVKEKPKMGRINTILSCISVPVILQDFVDEVLRHKDNKAEINFSIVIEMAQNFTRSRGIHALPGTKLAELFSPYLFK